ncbi:MAG: D-alanyl-D-alanine carboxypeptidase [Oscillospiraceae bacterium]|jgi:D-alanyl-D-alanine carboxypeptidase (penicillin-binding protein 5/6)|nr:D-alanyl-D-alanine carboxypeptidase [Oscillospiraceae bacterium]
MLWAKKWVRGIAAGVAIAAVLCSKVFALESALTSESTPPVQIAAKAAVLMDAATGKVLVQYHENDPLYPASVTKIMPLLLVAEALDSGKISFADPVTATAAAAGKGGSQIWLKEGETMTVEELVKAAVIGSANDACCALGDFLAGSEEAFVQQMNARAKELGMRNTHFVNCTGLDDDTTEHLTTALDIAIMSRELLKHNSVIKFATIWMDSLRGGETLLVNTNRLVRFYEGATGLKTGTTSKAGCCVSASAKRSGTHLIAVVMGSSNSDDRFETAKRLLNWGFANYATVTPRIAPALLTPVRVRHGQTQYITPTAPQAMTILVPKGSEEELRQSVELAPDVEAPVETGQILGKIVLTLDGETLGTYPLTAPQSVPKLTLFRALKLLLATLVG